MNDIEFRKMQEAVANIIKIKDEYAKGLFELYEAYQKAGFKKEEAMQLLLSLIKPQ